MTIQVFGIVCAECGEEIFQVVADRVVHPGIALNGEVFATCEVCGHTERYLFVEEDGTYGGAALE